jgi:7-cyano-7-deazaguanine reductase
MRRAGRPPRGALDRRRLAEDRGAARRRMLDFSSMPSATIETFLNPRPERNFEIAISCPEFTSVCPKTGLPDFGEIRITYVPDAQCIELKSLKYYFIEFRNLGIFYEHVTNQILDDLVAAIQPRRMTVVGDFSVRGGIKTVVTATYEK